MLSALNYELRYALRSLLSRPGFHALVIAVLAAGLGCVLFVGSIVNGLVLEPLPFADPDRLYHAGLIDNDDRGDGEDLQELSGGELLDWQRELDDVAAVGGYMRMTLNLSDGRRPERYAGAALAGDVLGMLGVQPQLGRALTAADQLPGAPVAVLLSDRVWRNRFNADPGVLGREIRVNAAPATVVGVLPAQFSFPWREQVWIAAQIDPSRPEQFDFETLLRRQPEVSAQQLQSRLDQWYAAAKQAQPERMHARALGAGMLPLAQHFVDRDTRGVFAVMATAVLLVLLIACANVANLLLTRVGSRQQELALRIALGASRRRLMLGLLIQSGLLSLAAVLIALPLAQLGVQLTLAVFHGAADDGPPLWMQFGLDARLIVLAVLASVLTALISGGLPALRAAAADDLQLRSGRGVDGGFARISRGLVIGQLAFSCAVLIATAFLVQTVRQLDRFDLGLDTQSVLTARLALVDQRYTDKAVLLPHLNELLRRIKADPEVVDASLGSSLPGLIGENIDVLARGAAMPERGAPSAGYSAVEPGFLRMMRADLVSGRDFDSGDDADSAAAMIVDQTFVERYSPDAEPLGREFVLDPGGETPRTARIVGVIRPVQMDDIDDAIEPAVFVPLAQDPERYLSLFVRTRAEPLAFIPRLQALAAEHDPDAPLYWIRDYSQVLIEASFGQRILARLFGGFGLVALLLAAAGLYGVMAYSVGQRTREIGVRRALGAVDLHVLRPVLGRSAGQVAIGLGLGLLLGLPLARLLSQQLGPGIGQDGVGGSVFLPVLAVLALTALLAAWLPARRALSVEPSSALRYE